MLAKVQLRPRQKAQWTHLPTSWRVWLAAHLYRAILDLRMYYTVQLSTILCTNDTAHTFLLLNRTVDIAYFMLFLQI